MQGAVPRCSHCGDVIGVYEPAVLSLGGVPRSTSIAAEPSAPVDAVWHHRDCFGFADADDEPEDEAAA